MFEQDAVFHFSWTCSTLNVVQSFVRDKVKIKSRILKQIIFRTRNSATVYAISKQRKYKEKFALFPFYLVLTPNFCFNSTLDLNFFESEIFFLRIVSKTVNN